jgi:hypothetical protein
LKIALVVPSRSQAFIRLALFLLAWCFGSGGSKSIGGAAYSGFALTVDSFVSGKEETILR